MKDKLNMSDQFSASVIRRPTLAEILRLEGKFTAECFNAEGIKLWDDEFENTVVTVGKNFALDTFLAGSAFTAVGPFIGLISSVSFSAIAAADTMTSHAGWLEAGGANAPTFTARITTNGGWSAAAAGAKALSAALSFTMTGAGTLEGAFLVTGAGAVVTVGSTAGTLFSAGLFSGGTRTVANTDVVNVSYSLSA